MSEAASGGGAVAGGAGTASPGTGGGAPSGVPNPGAGAGGNAAASQGAAPKAPAVHPGTVEGAPPNGAPAAPAEKTYKVRIGKKDVEVSRAQLLEELEKEVGEDGLLDLYKLKRGSYDRFEQAKKTESKAQQYERLLSDPKAVFSELARRHGPDKAAAMIEQQYKQIDQIRKMTPEQRAAWQRDQELKHYRTQEAQRRAQDEQRQKVEKAQATAQVVRGKFEEALKAIDLPANPATIARMAMHAKELTKKGVPVTYGDVAKSVREDIQNELRPLLKGVKREQIREWLGDELIQYIRQTEFEALSQQGPAPGAVAVPRGPDGKFVPVRGNPVTAPGGEPKKKLPIHEWRKQQAQLRRR